MAISVWLRHSLGFIVFCLAGWPSLCSVQDFWPCFYVPVQFQLPHCVQQALEYTADAVGKPWMNANGILLGFKIIFTVPKNIFLNIVSPKTKTMKEPINFYISSVNVARHFEFLLKKIWSCQIAYIYGSSKFFFFTFIWLHLYRSNVPAEPVFGVLDRKRERGERECLWPISHGSIMVSQWQTSDSPPLLFSLSISISLACSPPLPRAS